MTNTHTSPTRSTPTHPTLGDLARSGLVRTVALLAVAALVLALLAWHSRPVPTVRADVATTAAGALPIVGRCEGSQYTFEGDGTGRGQEGAYLITSLTHGIDAVLSSGRVSGRNEHQPLTFTTNVSRATPLFLQAIENNEVLRRCVFTTFGRDESGARVALQRIVLERPRVLSYRLVGKPADRSRVTIALMYESLEMTDLDTGIQAQVDWPTTA
ncbi:type VI secretion system tube protein Hcp [Nocardioides bruguierae]|uniref:type VI secretion system tube protein Hcp n=1 Tax=Nocardioides bruguierae TaxID=2945102 RepID=UPI002021BE4C|nr:type VI secretion system tube protein Hcp [Nocardioides bruguierae]MCL8025113.1 type VI secretion system tube protein Hcp [Nocardioides bruguierae]